jgi:hypothetical protein
MAGTKLMFPFKWLGSVLIVVGGIIFAYSYFQACSALCIDYSNDYRAIGFAVAAIGLVIIVVDRMTFSSRVFRKL